MWHSAPSTCGAVERVCEVLRNRVHDCHWDVSMHEVLVVTRGEGVALLARVGDGGGALAGASCHRGVEGVAPLRIGSRPARSQRKQQQRWGRYGWLGWNIAQSIEHHKGTKHPHSTELHSWYDSGRQATSTSLSQLGLKLPPCA